MQLDFGLCQALALTAFRRSNSGLDCFPRRIDDGWLPS
ncbi:hypothetical protein MUK42_27947 [Musa troglodytarum]|uniref:Uncharacterized protein n=1 Tax=Musa troglodytarum TaxID=320322 RepID=A0A9E7G9D9_9LILI|nr:hypothetical protein MUK42_27947 [Musa troglodytarum]